MTANTLSGIDRGPLWKAASRISGTVIDALILLAVFGLTVFVLIFVAIAAPLTLAISATAGALERAQKRDELRETGDT